jgi:hypothetical protein
MDKLSEEIVKEKETNIQIGNAGGVNNKTRKTAWAEVEENDSHVKIGNTSIHRQSTSTADRNINEQNVSYKIWITNITESQFHEYNLKKEAKLLSTCTYTCRSHYQAFLYK